MSIILNDDVISKFPSGLGAAEAVGLFVIADSLRGEKVNAEILGRATGLDQKRLVKTMEMLVSSGLAVRENQSIRFLFDLNGSKVQTESKSKSNRQSKKNQNRSNSHRFDVRKAIKTVEALGYVYEETLADILEVPLKSIQSWRDRNILRSEGVLQHQGESSLSNLESKITKIVASEGLASWTDIVLESGVPPRSVRTVLTKSPWIKNPSRGVYQLATHRASASDIKSLKVKSKVVQNSGVASEGVWIVLVVSKSLLWKKVIQVPTNVADFLPSKEYVGQHRTINVKNNEIVGIEYPGMSMGDQIELIFNVNEGLVKIFDEDGSIIG